MANGDHPFVEVIIKATGSPIVTKSIACTSEEQSEAIGGLVGNLVDAVNATYNPK